MTKRIKTALLGIAATAALVAGGATFANAASSSAPERPSAPDTDNIQAGDQTTPDKPAAKPSARVNGHGVRLAPNHAATRTDGDTVQSGDQTTPDPAGPAVSEKPGAENPETGAGSESAAPNDGPGGHADATGNSTVDHQFQGTE